MNDLVERWQDRVTITESSGDLWADLGLTRPDEGVLRYVDKLHQQIAADADEIERLRSRQAQSQGEAVVGWQLVPVKPTDAMTIEACAIPGVSLEAGKRMWAAFLRKAPSPPLARLDEAEVVERVAFALMKADVEATLQDLQPEEARTLTEMSARELFDRGHYHGQARAALRYLDQGNAPC